MMDATLVTTVIVTGVLSGVVSSIGTVAALGVRVDWAHETAKRAHSRIDNVDEVVKDHGNRITALEAKAR